MEGLSKTLLPRIQNPFFQAVIVLAAVLLVNLGAIFARSLGLEMEQRFPWTTAASFMLFFAAGNAIGSILATNTEQYWTRSILSFVGTAGLSALMAYWFSSLSIHEAGPYRWIFIVITIGYLVFLSIVNLAKLIVNFAQKEEWTQPRMRRRRR